MTAPASTLPPPPLTLVEQPEPIDYSREHSYREIARHMGISWQAVQQAEISGLRKLAKVPRFRRLFRLMVDS